MHYRIVHYSGSSWTAKCCMKLHKQILHEHCKYSEYKTTVPP